MIIKRRSYWPLIIAIVAFGLFVGGFWWLDNRPKPTTQLTIADLGLSIRHATDLEAANLSETDVEDSLRLKLVPKTDVDQGLLITVRFEDGLESASKATNQPALAVIAENARRSFPQRYPNFALISERNLEINGMSAVELNFMYDSPQGPRIQQALTALMVSGDRALYFTTQAKQPDFARFTQEYFTPLIESVSLQ